MGLVLYFDGGCLPNPGGTPCYGWVLRDIDGDVIEEGYGVLEERGFPKTNNTAEWGALIQGVRFAVGLKPSRLEIRGDSQMVIEQLNLRWKAKKPHLVQLRRSEE